MDFATWLKSHRKSRNISQAKLAIAVEIPQSRISKYESGKQLPSTEDIDTLHWFFDKQAELAVESNTQELMSISINSGSAYVVNRFVDGGLLIKFNDRYYEAREI